MQDERVAALKLEVEGGIGLLVADLLGGEEGAGKGYRLLAKSLQQNGDSEGDEEERKTFWHRWSIDACGCGILQQG